MTEDVMWISVIIAWSALAFASFYSDPNRRRDSIIAGCGFALLALALAVAHGKAVAQ